MDAETTPVGEEVVEPLLSNLDIFLFSVIVGLVVYWFIFRKKPEPVPEFKKIDSQWVFGVWYLHIIFCGDMNCVKTSNTLKQYTLGCETRHFLLVYTVAHWNHTFIVIT